MSKQLAISAALSVLMMASYVLLGADAVREPRSTPAGAAMPIEISAVDVPSARTLLPLAR